MIVGRWSKSWKLGGEAHHPPQRLEEVNPPPLSLTTPPPFFPLEVDKILVPFQDPLVDDPSRVLFPAPAPDLVLYLALVPLLLEDVTPIPVPPHLPLVQIVKDPLLLPEALVEDVHLQDQGPGHPIAIDRGVGAGVGVIQDREARAAADHHHAGGSGGIVLV